MSTGLALDSVLAGLARPFGRSSDLLLDLRQWAGNDRRAGSCLKAYFDLLDEAAAAGEATRGLVRLRQWLETELEVVVLDQSGTCLEILPLELMGEIDLERYCHQVMNRLLQDRCYGESKVGVIVRFKQRSAQAA